MRKSRILLALGILIIGTAFIGFSIDKSTSLGNQGTLITIGIEAWWDAEKTNMTTTIDWGSMYPNDTHTITLYLHNPGNNPISLVKTYYNFTPSIIEPYCELSWTPDVISLLAGETLEVQHSLHINYTILDLRPLPNDFSYFTLLDGSSV